MKKIIIVSLAVAITVVLLSSTVIAGFGQISTQNNDDNDENDKDDDTEHSANTAGGGGWFEENSLKNTFGFYLNASNLTNSSIVFHARFSSMKIHGINISQIAIEDDDGDGNWTAHAYGNATVNKMINFTFHFQVSDCGKGENDRIDLWVESEDQSYHWGIDGLGGGNIWIMPLD